MGYLSIKLGYWSSVSIIILSILYGIGFPLAMFIFPIPHWTNLAAFTAAAKPVSLMVFGLCQAMAFLIAPAQIIQFCSLHEYAPDDKKILTKLGLCFMTAVMILGNQMYFLHFNTIRLIIAKADLTGLEQFVEWNANSAIMASGTLGWTFFAGLGLFFVAPIFSGGRLEQWLRSLLFIGGCFGMLGLVGWVLSNVTLGIIYGLGGTTCLIVASVLLSILFKRHENKI
jgi:hypothetical protein